MTMNKNKSDRKKEIRSQIYQKTIQRTPEITWKTQNREKLRSCLQKHYYREITGR